MAEIAALAAEEERLASQARERAQHREKARAEENARAEAALKADQVPQPSESRWNAMAILKGLAKLRAGERSAAEELIRKAHEVRDEHAPESNDSQPDTRELAPEPHASPLRGMWSPSLGATQVWYFTSAGTRCGPVTFEELRTMAAARVLDPRLDMVWKEGMDGWKQAGLLDGLFERRAVPAGATETRRLKRPGRVLTALPKDLTAALANKHVCWPGVGRLPLWLGLLLFPLLWDRLLWWSTPTLSATFGGVLTSMLLPLASIVPFAVLIYLVLMRLVNLGMSRWWALVLAIPVLNLWVGFRCLVCPSGFAHHRKLDRSGWFIAVAVLVAVPAVWYVHLKYPGWLSPAQLQTALFQAIAKVVEMIAPR